MFGDAWDWERKLYKKGTFAEFFFIVLSKYVYTLVFVGNKSSLG